MRVRCTIPALRDDLEIVELRGQRYLEDGLRRVRVPVDDLCLKICEALADGPLTPAELTSRVSAGRLDCYERVVLLNRHVMLASTRAQESVALHREGEPGASNLDGSLSHSAALRHSCTGCGACCTGTDLGPLSDEDVARIEAIDWSPHLDPEVKPEDWVIEVEMQSGEVARLLGRRDDRCVFLRPDNKCTIHAVAGADQKPLMCRQFPHFFVREPESPSIHVGFSTECRSWHHARIDGSSVDDSRDSLWKILEEKKSVVVLRPPFAVWDGLDWSWAVWREVREAQLQRLQEAEDFGGLIDAVTEPVLEVLSGAMEAAQEDEIFATRLGWGIPEPPAGGLAGRGAFESFQEDSRRLAGVLGGGIEELSERYGAAGERAMGRRHSALSDAICGLLSGQTPPPVATTPEAFQIWREMALAAIDSHEIVRGESILFETARLNFKLILARHDCHQGISDGMRAQVDSHDVVDRMVRVTKMLRGALVSALMRQARRELVALFLFNSSVFVHGQAPRALGIDAKTRLPGELR